MALFFVRKRRCFCGAQVGAFVIHFVARYTQSIVANFVEKLYQADCGLDSAEAVCLVALPAVCGDGERRPPLDAFVRPALLLVHRCRSVLAFSLSLALPVLALMTALMAARFDGCGAVAERRQLMLLV